MSIQSKQSLFSVLLLLIIVMLIFYPCLSFDFLLGWDDNWQVFNNYTYNGLKWQNIVEIFSSFYMGQYSPVNQLVYSLIYDLCGMNAFFYHLVNIVLHISCVILVFFMIKKILLLCGEVNLRKINMVSLLTAMCMAVHPLQVETVAWISASKILWSSFFFLLGIISYLNYVSKQSSFSYIGTICFFILSFLSKEQAVIFPLCLLLVDLSIRRQMQWRFLLLEKIPFILLSFLFCLITVLSYEKSIIGVVDNGLYSIDQRLVFVAYSLIEYVTKLIIPVNLMYMYPFLMQPGEVVPSRFYINLVAFFALCYMMWVGRKQTIFMFGSLFFLLQLILMLHIVPMPRATITADRYLYLACIGFFFPIVWFLVGRFLDFRAYWKWILICFLGYIVFMGIYSHRHLHKWESNETLKKEMREILHNRK